MIRSQIRQLPQETLSSICKELGQDRDFDTLYRLAQSCKSCAAAALRELYQVHQHSPVFEQRDDLDSRLRSSDEPAKNDRDLKKSRAELFRGWTVLWRSIILSSLDREDGPLTYSPYCRYIRILDLRNFVAMMEDTQFSEGDFFDGPLRKFRRPRGSKTHADIPMATRIARDHLDIVNAVGAAITQKTTLLEEIDGHIKVGFLPEWISRSPRLQSMVLWKGYALLDGAGQAIADHCEKFNSLTVHDWLSTNADAECSTFLNELNPDTLTHFEIISYNQIGKLSFEALGRHQRLQHLELGNLGEEAVASLHALRNCTAIHTLKLHDNFGVTDLEGSHNDVFLEIINWIGSCTELRDLSLKKFYDGPTLLSRILSSPSVKLKRLSLEDYTVRTIGAQLFHSALADQSSLESLWLKGNGEDVTSDDLEILIQGLCSLTDLRELVLKDVSDEFTEYHIMTLAARLPRLEEFWTSGGEVSGSILPVLARLKYLKNLTLLAMTQFESNDIMDFLYGLDDELQ
jgi:hypothetical protein